MRTTKSGQAASRKQKWPLMDLMSFLDRYTEEISTDSNFQQACHEEGNSGDSGDEDSVSVSERSEVSSFQHDTQDEAQNGRGPSPTPSSSTMSSSVPVKPRTGSQLTPKSVPAKSAASGKGKKRPFQQDSQLDNAIVELINVQAKNRESLDSMLKTDEEPKSVARSFLESCILKMEKLPQQKQSYLQLQISQLFFNAENPDIDPIPITPLPQKNSPLPNQFMYMEDQSSSASNIIARAMEMTNDMSDC